MTVFAILAAVALQSPDTGAVLWAKRPHERRPIASTTKIMTGVLALEHLPLGKVLRINPLVTRVALNREGLRAHERVAVRKLMDGLLLFSGNDDALELAIATAGSRGAFLRLMNEKAAELDLHDTHYTSPSGVVDRGNYSSAYRPRQMGETDLREDVREQEPAARHLPRSRRRQDRLDDDRRPLPRRLRAPRGHEVDRRRAALTQSVRRCSAPA